MRIVHVPTGLSVKCTQERTQLLNRAIAMELLRAKLLVVLEEQQAREVCGGPGGRGGGEGCCRGRRPFDVVQTHWGEGFETNTTQQYDD